MTLAVGWLLTHGHADWRADGKFGLAHWLTYINPAARLLDFVVGMLIWRCPRPRLSPRLATGLEGLSVVALLGAMVVFSRLGLPEVLRAQLLYLPLMALVIHAFAPGAGALSAGLRNRRLVVLGDASFALYMIHLPILNGAYILYERWGEPAPIEVYAVGIAAVAVGASVVTYLWLERPATRHLKGLVRD